MPNAKNRVSNAGTTAIGAQPMSKVKASFSVSIDEERFGPDDGFFAVQ
jgi:hypothetical protein